MLHIGLEKTGSTSIQSSMSKSRLRLLAHGVLYPQAFGNENHIKAYAYASETGVDLVKARWELDSPASVERFRTQLREELAEEVAAAEPRLICVSNEHCSTRLLRISEIQRLRSLLMTHCSSIKVVIYLRRQGEALRSAYSTYIKTGGAAPFSSPGPDQINKRYDYDIILGRWASVFGDSNLDIRIFDRQYLVDGDVVTDFFTNIGVPPPEPTLGEDLNRSLGCIGLEFLRKFNDYVPYTMDTKVNPLRGDIQHIIEEFPDDTPFVGDADVMEALESAMSDSNERVRARYLPNWKGPLFPPVTRRRPIAPKATATKDDFVKLMAHLWGAKQKQVAQLRTRLRKEGRQNQALLTNSK